MINGLLIAWAALASLVALTLGLFVAFARGGTMSAGLLVTVLSLAVGAALLGYVTGRSRWRRRTYVPQVVPQRAVRPARTQSRGAPSPHSAAPRATEHAHHRRRKTPRTDVAQVDQAR